jgi:hypothetical protein
VDAHHRVPRQRPAARGPPHVAEADCGFEGQAVQQRPGGPRIVPEDELQEEKAVELIRVSACC